MKFKYNRKRKVIVSNTKLQKIITRLAKQINKDYKNKELVLICLMNSSFMFLAELIKQLHIDLEVEFLKVFTYSKVRGEKVDVQRIQQSFDWKRLKNRDVIILDELVDTGDTMEFVTKQLKKLSHPKSIKTCAMLVKDWDRPYYKCEIDYLGAKIPNVWITGHGMGYKYKYRNLLDIVQLSDKEKGINKYESKC